MGLAGAMLDLVYPRHCGACGDPVSDEGLQICWDCLAGLHPVVDPFCSRCGDPVEGMIEHAFVCGFCRKHEPGFDLARSAVRYRGGICDALQTFKYRSGVHLVDDLARLLYACVRTQYADVAFDAVCGVPLYAVRERARTYNQARLLADRLARHLRVEAAPTGTLRRVRNTPTQTGLNSAQRRENVDGAFSSGQAAWLEGRIVLLVDDVMTTGATVDEVSRALRQNGAAGVYVVTVARG